LPAIWQSGARIARFDLMRTMAPLRPFASMVDLIHHRAAVQPNDRACIFLSDRGNEETVLTFAELDRRALAVAARLAERTRKGDRALLVFPAGLDFLVAYFGCLLAGVIAVPMMVPRRASSRDSSDAIMADCGARMAMTGTDLAGARPDVIARFRDAGLEWFILDASDDTTAAEQTSLPAPDREDIAFLQYTSGSTSSPKGVVVTHRNLLENLEMMRVAFGNSQASTCVNWVPLYHDMGLIVTALESLYVGALCVHMAPVTFIQRPMTWLRAIHTYRAEVAGGPNFAFDLPVTRFRPEQIKDIDLSCWKLAFVSAEPVRADTLERFSSTLAPYGFNPRAIYPGFGLAEATVLVSCPPRKGDGLTTRMVSRDALQRGEVAAPRDDDDRRVLVGCGRNLAGERIAIVHPDRHQRLAPGHLGEVWVNGPNVARGYWQNEDATASAFGARIDGEAEEPWLRTGDLGFLDEAGELYITGRIKDVIIIRGMNHYPQDIEHTMEKSHPALRRHCGAAFTIAGANDEEKLVLVQEVERTQRHRVSTEDIIGCIRAAVTNEHEIAVHRIVLLPPGVIPKTTSGKIQRNLTRKLWLENALEVLV
jgi:acyl-CoA synthetase (AMP-forming)/AMP-acid ligase II